MANSKLPLSKLAVVVALSTAISLGSAMYVLWKHPQPPSRSVWASSSGMVQLDCYCATDYESIASLLRAYHEMDREALHGLVSRGRAIQLRKGTRIHLLDSDNG